MASVTYTFTAVKAPDPVIAATPDVMSKTLRLMSLEERVKWDVNGLVEALIASKLFGPKESEIKEWHEAFLKNCAVGTLEQNNLVAQDLWMLNTDYVQEAFLAANSEADQKITYDFEVSINEILVQLLGDEASVETFIAEVKAMDERIALGNAKLQAVTACAQSTIRHIAEVVSRVRAANEKSNTETLRKMNNFKDACSLASASTKKTLDRVSQTMQAALQGQKQVATKIQTTGTAMQAQLASSTAIINQGK